MPWARDQMNAMAVSLVAAGLAVWNLEYRRLGVPGAGWPGTMKDVRSGIEHLARLAADGADLDPERVFGVVGLAPIADLVRAQEERVGNDAVSELLGGGSRQYPERYRPASPAGDSCDLIELPGTGHMEFLDPASEAFAAFVGRLTRLLAAR